MFPKYAAKNDLVQGEIGGNVSDTVYPSWIECVGYALFDVLRGGQLVEVGFSKHPGCEDGGL